LKRKWFLGCLGLFVVIIAIAVVVKVEANRREATREKAALQDQLRLARSEGIPTTWQEFAATIRPAKLSENAAPFYRRLKEGSFNTTDFAKLEHEVAFNPSSEHLSSARAFLAQKKDDLDLVDQATKLPRCWFDRDWSKGAAVLGSVAAAEGHPEEALRNIQQVLAISLHAGDEETAMAFYTSRSVFAIGFHHLALWALIHRDVPAYHKAMEEALRNWPKYDLLITHRDDLLNVRTLVALSTTEKGRAELGVKPDEVSKLETPVSLLANRSKANIQIVKAEREIWAAYKEPAATRLSKMHPAQHDLMVGLAAYPTGAQFYYALTQEDDGTYLVDQSAEAQRLCNVALARALKQVKIPKTMNLDGLRSPIDGKPLDYSFDGRQITISARQGRPLKLPSDEELASTPKKVLRNAPKGP